MKLRLDKLIFPRLERDQRRRAMSELLFIAFITVAVGFMIASVVLLVNHRRW